MYYSGDTSSALSLLSALGTVWAGLQRWGPCLCCKCPWHFPTLDQEGSKRALLSTAQLVHHLPSPSVPPQSKVPYDSIKTLLPCFSLQWPPYFIPAPYFLLNETKSLSFNQGPSWRMTRLSFIFFFFSCALIGRTNLTGLGFISPYRLALTLSKIGTTFSFPEQSLRKGNCYLPCEHCRDVPDAVPLYFSVLHWEVLSWICLQISLVISVSTSYIRSYY